MIDLKPLVHTILKANALSPHGTHGVGHWARVLENGIRWRGGTDATSEIVQLSYFPRFQTINESVDHGHGRRGAELAAECVAHCSIYRTTSLIFFATPACTTPMVGRCRPCGSGLLGFADRLDLGRRGIVLREETLHRPPPRRGKLSNGPIGGLRLSVVPEVGEGTDWGIDMRR